MSGGKQKRNRTIRVGLGLLLLAAFLAIACDARLCVRYYQIESDQIAAPVRLAVVADLHSCAYGAGQRALTDAVLALEPDAVALVGDIVDDVLPEKNAWDTVSFLAERLPCFYVTGNHEYMSGEAERICREMEAAGVEVLRGSSVRITTAAGQTLRLSGIDDPKSGRSGRQLAQVGAALDPGELNVLLAHRPEDIRAYLAYPFDLVLSGHAHGGQWRVPGLINGLYAPNQGLFPRYAGGWYTFPETGFAVSRGLARESTRIPRLFNRPELVAVDVTPP